MVQYIIYQRYSESPKWNSDPEDPSITETQWTDGNGLFIAILDKTMKDPHSTKYKYKKVSLEEVNELLLSWYGEEVYLEDEIIIDNRDLEMI